MMGRCDGRCIIAVVDDDESVRSAIAGILMSVGLPARTFASAEAFFESGLSAETACLITDVQMTGMSGLELLTRLTDEGRRIPTIFITAYGDPATRARAMSAGAVGFLGKPFDDELLIEKVRAALEN